MSMESPYATCTIGPNFYTDFWFEPSFGRYGPIRVPAPFSPPYIEGLGFEPRTLEFEVQVLATLATEARLVDRFATLFLYLLYHQGFALACCIRSTLAFCWCRKPHFGASIILLTSSPELHLVARRPVMLPLFSPLVLGAMVQIASPARLDHAVYLRVLFPSLWLVLLPSHAWEELCSWTLCFYSIMLEG